MSELEKEEPCISKEFSKEIEKYAKLEGISPEKCIQRALKDRFERLQEIYPDAEALCPSGCGTKLVKHKFIDVLSEPENAEEDLYCQKCGIRWIAEQHSPLN